mgnify:FL=1
MNYPNYEVTLYHSYLYILEQYYTIEKYIDEFIKNNQDLIISHDYDYNNSRLDMTVVLNGKECHRHILQFGFVKIWRTNSRITKIKPETLKIIVVP